MKQYLDILEKVLGNVEIKDDVFNGFPAIKTFEEQTLNMAKTKGFVTTVCGRKRRSPDMQLPEYSISYTKEYTNATGLTVVPKELCDSYTNKLNSMYNKQRNEFNF